jgi:hypothetical protein
MFLCYPIDDGAHHTVNRTLHTEMIKTNNLETSGRFTYFSRMFLLNVIALDCPLPLLTDYFTAVRKGSFLVLFASLHYKFASK